MGLRTVFTSVALAAGLATSAAQAATFDLTSILSYTDNGFGSSLIHDQTRGSMSGNKVADVDSTITGGTYDTDTNAISFDGSISSGGQSSTYSASGELFESARADGLFGYINFAFTGDLFDGMDLTFDFADMNFTSGNEPNGFASSGGTNFIALWGDTGMFANYDCDECYGIDLRIAFEPSDGGGGVVPLPASAFLLMAGIGGLGAARKLKKKA